MRLGSPALPPRISVIQSELDRFSNPRYLEIGIFDGLVFTRVNASTKVAVDPHIRISKVRRALLGMRSGVSLHEVPSDDYFASLAAKTEFDVIFVDGLHLYEQALRDTENSLAHLADGGVVLVHDCNPTAAAVADRDPGTAIKAGHRAWCGDVWKAVVHLRATRQDLSVRVIDTDFGIGVVRRGERGTAVDMSPAEVAQLTYADLAADRERLLGLVPPEDEQTSRPD
jgi:hypothetical protein